MRKDDLMKYYEPLMRGCSVLETEVGNPYSVSLSKASYGRLGDPAYDIRKDKHVAKAFKPAFNDSEKQQTALNMVALCIVSNLCLYSLDIPDPPQIHDLIALSPYSTDEWNDYANSLPYETRSCFNGQKRFQIGAILYRTLADYLHEDSKVLTQEQKKKRQQGGKSGDSQKFYHRHFHSIVSYLFDHDLLSFLTLGGVHFHESDPLYEALSEMAKDGDIQTRTVEPYENAVKRYGELDCLRRIVSGEILDFKKLREQETDRLYMELRKQADRKIRGALRGNTKPQNPLALAAARQEMESFQLFQSPASVIPSFGSMDKLPPQAEQIYEMLKGAYDEYDEKAQRFSDYERALIQNARAEFAAIAEREAEYLREDFATEIAESAFLAILEGDEIYKTGVGIHTFRILVQNSCIPDTSIYVPELEDEDDWDYIAFPGDNGRLENVVLRESDVAVFDSESLDGLKSAVKLGSAIAGFAECKINLPIAIRKSQVKAFRQMGCSDRKARDYALIVAALRSANFSDAMEDNLVQYFPDSGEAQAAAQAAPSDTPVSEEVTAARKALDEAQRQRKAAERESQQLRHELAKLRRELEQTQVQLERSTSLLELYENREEDPQDGPEEGDAIQFPFTTSRKIVLYGGFHSFHQDISRLIPGIRIIPCASRIDVAPVRNADVVFIQINKTSHSGYWSVCDAAKVSGVPYFHLNYAGPKRCAEEMVRIISDLNAKKRFAHQ